MSLVMRLEVMASKCDQAVKESLGSRTYYAEAADLRDLLQEAARKIKELEHENFIVEAKRIGGTAWP